MRALIVEPMRDAIDEPIRDIIDKPMRAIIDEQVRNSPRLNSDEGHIETPHAQDRIAGPPRESRRDFLFAAGPPMREITDVPIRDLIDKPRRATIDKETGAISAEQGRKSLRLNSDEGSRETPHIKDRFANPPGARLLQGDAMLGVRLLNGDAERGEPERLHPLRPPIRSGERR